MSGGLRGASREADLRLASLHLRTGSLALARAELEAAHVDEALVVDALTDLAEARWRTGDLEGAGAAAAAALAGGAEASMARVILIEAGLQLADGVDLAARQETTAIAPEDLDRIFAGMARGPAWPPDAWTYPVAGGERHDPGAPGRTHLAGLRGDTAPRSGGSVAAAPRSLAEPHQRELVGRAGLADDPAADLDAAGDDLATGDEAAAAIRLAVLLRAAPSTAPAVAELLEDTTSPMLVVVKGDALRLLGRAGEAERAWAEAMASLSTRGAGMASQSPDRLTKAAPGGSTANSTGGSTANSIGGSTAPNTDLDGALGAPAVDRPSQEEPS